MIYDKGVNNPPPNIPQPVPHVMHDTRYMPGRQSDQTIQQVGDAMQRAELEKREASTRLEVSEKSNNRPLIPDQKGKSRCVTDLKKLTKVDQHLAGLFSPKLEKSARTADFVKSQLDLATQQVSIFSAKCQKEFTTENHFGYILARAREVTFQSLEGKPRPVVIDACRDLVLFQKELKFNLIARTAQEAARAGQYTLEDEKYATNLVMTASNKAKKAHSALSFQFLSSTLTTAEKEQVELALEVAKKDMIICSHGVAVLGNVHHNPNSGLILGWQPLNEAQNVLVNIEDHGGTYNNISENNYGFIVQDQGHTRRFADRKGTRTSENAKLFGSRVSQCVPTFSFGATSLTISREIMESFQIDEVVCSGTSGGYKTIPFNSSSGLINVSIPGTLNLNVKSSAKPFPQKYMDPLKNKTRRSCLFLQDNPNLVQQIQNGELTVDEFRGIGEEA